jgi:hypothetical protein
LAIRPALWHFAYPYAILQNSAGNTTPGMLHARPTAGGTVLHVWSTTSNA